MKGFTAFSLALLGVAIATPVPQDIDFDSYNAIPVAEDLSAPIGNPEPVAVATYDPSAAASSAVAAATAAAASAIAAAATSAPDSTDGSDDASDLSKRAVCSSEGAGNYPTSNPDTPAGFQSDPTIAALALNAVEPPGYFLSAGYQNLLASASDNSYQTFVTLSSYNPALCAAHCSSTKGCMSFNIYFERDPSVYPNSDACPNPPSVTRIKCALFSKLITPAQAVNKGQWVDSFHVVIAGSNVYTTTPQPIPGFTGPVSLGNATINAPYTPVNTYIKVQSYSATQPYDPSICTAACLGMNGYWLANDGGDPTSVANDLCSFTVAYILYKNGANGVFTCTYYTQAWGPQYATNFGQYDGTDHYTIGSSYSYTIVGNPEDPTR